MKTTLEVGEDGIRDGEHFVPYSQIRSIDKGGGRWLGYDIELVWGNKGAWASHHSSGHEFNFGDDVESRDRAYELIVSGIAVAAQPQVERPDILDQIKKLAELRDSGALTQEEFEAKKTELLAKM